MLLDSPLRRGLLEVKDVFKKGNIKADKCSFVRQIIIFGTFLSRRISQENTFDNSWIKFRLSFGMVVNKSSTIKYLKEHIRQ